MQTKFNEMVLTIKKPGQDIIDSWTPAKASAAHMLTGLLDEFFELLEAYTLFSEDPSPKHKKLVVEEAGDSLFYIRGMEQDLDLRGIDFNYKTPFVRDLDVNMVMMMMQIVTLTKRHLYYNKPLDKEALAEALEMYVAIVMCISCDEAGVTLDEVLEANMVKLLKGRYKSGYSDEAANKREDKTDD